MTQAQFLETTKIQFYHIGKEDGSLTMLELQSFYFDNR